MTTTTTTTPIPAQAAPPDAVEEFAGRMTTLLNDGMLALMVSIGHRTGLFEAMSGAGHLDSTQLAQAAGLQERYVREWLGAMATGRLVELDADAGTYRLPDAHAALLTRAAGPMNLASFAQTVAMLGAVEDGIVEAFREGGGVPYSAFPAFQRVMAQQSAQVLDAVLVDAVLPLVPGLRERLEQGIDVLDVGCGAGHAVNLLAQTFPRSRFTGLDLSEEGLARAREEAASLGLDNAAFELRDAAQLSGPAAYDLVTTFDAVHDQVDPAAVLRGIHDVLRPGGTYLCVDIGADSEVAGNLEHPFAPFFYTVSTMHCMTVSLAEGGAGLGTCWGRQTALRMLGEAGFSDVQVHGVEGDLANAYYVARRD